MLFFQTDLLTLDSGNHKQKIREFETKIQVRRIYQKQLNFRELTHVMQVHDVSWQSQFTPLNPLRPNTLIQILGSNL